MDNVTIGAAKLHEGLSFYGMTYVVVDRYDVTKHT